MTQPHPVDIQVGQRVRITRRAKGVSQTKLATAVGVTFQQVQKYENGKNRLSVSRLSEIAKFLGVDVPYFFTDLITTDGKNTSGSSSATVFDLNLSRLDIAIARGLSEIENTRLKRRLADLIIEIALASRGTLLDDGAE